MRACLAVVIILALIFVVAYRRPDRRGRDGFAPLWQPWYNYAPPWTAAPPDLPQQLRDQYPSPFSAPVDDGYKESRAPGAGLFVNALRPRWSTWGNRWPYGPWTGLRAGYALPLEVSAPFARYQAESAFV